MVFHSNPPNSRQVTGLQEKPVFWVRQEQGNACLEERKTQHQAKLKEVQRVASGGQELWGVVAWRGVVGWRGLCFSLCTLCSKENALVFIFKKLAMFYC